MMLQAENFTAQAPAFTMEGQLEMAIANIRQRVETRRYFFMGLHERQQIDQQIYDLYPFDGEDGFGSLSETKRRTYTSNAPRVFADKVMAHIMGGKLIFKIPTAREFEEQRTNNQTKKDFLTAALKMADMRLESRAGKPSVVGADGLFRSPAGLDLRALHPENRPQDRADHGGYSAVGPNGLDLG